MPGAISTEASYVGNVSRHLTISRNVNEVPDQFLNLRTRLNARVPNPFYQVITDPTSALSQPTITVSQLLRPLPQYIGVTEAVLPLGTSDYDSLQLQLSKRMAHGLTFGASYTFSKLMEATSYLNDNDAAPEEVISNSDRPHRIVLHGLYELPFGPGKRLSQIFGGWQLTWVATFHSRWCCAVGPPWMLMIAGGTFSPRSASAYGRKSSAGTSSPPAPRRYRRDGRPRRRRAGARAAGRTGRRGSRRRRWRFLIAVCITGHASSRK